MSNMHSVNIEISEEALFDQVESAIEGPANYWARIDVGLYLPRHSNYFTAKFFDVATNTEHTLSIPKLLTGLSILALKYPKHFAAIFSGAYPKGDLLVQCALLGDIIYK